MNYSTPQESFWAGQFGDDYIQRNKGEKLLASNLKFFNLCLNGAGKIDSCLELGANIGMNLKALQLLYPSTKLSGVEINPAAHKELKKLIEPDQAILSSIFDYKSDKRFDLTISKGVLIHIHPDKLSLVYQKLYDYSKKFVLIAEYYNPSPVKINYRGEKDRLFKRDFAGEFLDQFPDTELIDNGFSYHRDPVFPQDDISWFLIKKK